MLHYWLLFLGLLGSPEGAYCELKDYPSVDFATEAHRRALAHCLDRLTVSFMVDAPRQKYLTVPGRRGTEVRGVMVGTGKLLTAAAVANLELRGSSGTKRPQVLRLSPTEGVALLAVSEGTYLVKFMKDKIERGRVFFTLDGNRRLHRLSFDKMGRGGLAYYWEIPIALPIGTPIVNAQGNPVSIVAVRDVDKSYVLPHEAFELFFKADESAQP